MIGRGLIVFKYPDGRNDLHFCNAFELLLSSSEVDDFDNLVKKLAKQEKWKPEATVSDSDVVAIQKATSCLDGDEGYHEYASDMVRVIPVTVEELCFTVQDAAKLYIDIIRKSKKQAISEIRKIMKKHNLNIQDVREEVSRIRGW